MPEVNTDRIEDAGPTDSREALLRRMFEAAIAAAQPAVCVPPHLPDPPRGRTIVIGAGKASAAMAQALERHWRGPPERLEGLVVTRYGHAVPCERIEIVEAAHPVPDEAGERAARRMLEQVAGLTTDDLVIALISGGASALLVAPAPGLGLADKQAVNAALLASGASITEMNCVRRHLSRIKGGRLGAACHPARLLTLLISDVPGDRPVDIGSGPTVADPSTCADALAIIDRHAIALPAAARAWLEAGGAAETVKPGDPRLADSHTVLIATPQQSLEAAARVAEAAGYQPCLLGDSLEGEAREVGRTLAGIARQVVQHGQPLAAPCVLISGGETTVTLRSGSRGRGGRNVEYLLALALALDGLPAVHALAGDTDGIDGIEEIAGAVLAPDTLERARQAGLDARSSLDANDGHGFFGALDAAVVTGPTLTNVNDFRAILIDRT